MNRSQARDIAAEPDRNFLFRILSGLVVATLCSGFTALATALTVANLN